MNDFARTDAHNSAGADYSPDPVCVEWGETWPSLPEFRALAGNRRIIPVVRRLLSDELSAVGIYRKLANDDQGTFILESAEHGGAWGRWSFVGINSAGFIVMRDGKTRWQGSCPEGTLPEGTFLDVLHSVLSSLRAAPIEGLPPLTGALVGALGWGIIPEWEPNLSIHAQSENAIPDACLCLTSDVAAIDHSDGSIWLIANAWNMDGGSEGVDGAYADAVSRLDDLTDRLTRPLAPSVLRCSGKGNHTSPAVTPRTSQSDFESSVYACQRAIRDGEAFQIVVSQRFDVETDVSGLDVYRLLRTINPSPYMYYQRLPNGLGGEFEVVGSSPETLVKVEGRRATSFPIAGSRPRGTTTAEDERLAQELLHDPKELSEHIMLVDLARNDLSKVCSPESIDVSSLMDIKRFSHIQHISSTVTGYLREGVDALDALVATFPAGTLSGAPKPRAIEIIDELEPAARGIYGGVVGYFDLSGDADFAIAIRTATLSDGVASVQAGAGIVADSIAKMEHQEACNKAAAALSSVLEAASMTRV